jgi:hypothetical protein
MKFDKVVYNIGVLQSEVAELEKKKRNHAFELDSISNLKENDTTGLEKKLHILEKSIKSLLNRKNVLDEQIKEQEYKRTDIIRANMKVKEEYTRIKENNRSELNKFDGEIAILQNKKSVSVYQKATIRDQMEVKIKTLKPEPQ